MGFEHTRRISRVLRCVLYTVGACAHTSILRSGLEAASAALELRAFEVRVSNASAKCRHTLPSASAVHVVGILFMGLVAPSAKVLLDARVL